MKERERERENEFVLMTTSSPSSDRVGIRRHNEINLNDYRVIPSSEFL